MDYDEVVVHLSYAPVRDLYRLETSWTEARQAPLPEPFSALACQLRLSA
ncbi:MAG TPA: hypothetical protein VKV28_11055 [Candidatus Binataceae bacterium]|nr:hypothetical protein [Candidatus Binataceae bacterium]